MTSKTVAEIIKRASLPVKPLQTSAQKTLEKENKSSNAGAGWFNMPLAKMTPELQAELRALRLRSVIDPKRHYKSEKPGNSEFLQVGTIVDDPSDFYSSKINRISRKKQSRSIVASLIQDEDSRQYFKKRFEQAQQKSQAGTHKSYQKHRNQLRKPWNRDSKSRAKRH